MMLCTVVSQIDMLPSATINEKVRKNMQGVTILER
jgi:hypothetical protein